jgi:hypothetical protein
MSSRNGSKFWGPIIRSHLHSCHVKYFRSSCKIPLRRRRAYHNCSRLGKLVSVPNTASNTAHSSNNIWYYSSRERLGIQAANSKRKRSFRKYLSTATRVPCSSVQYKKGNTSRRWSRMNQTILDKHQTVALLLKKTSAMRVFWTHFFTNHYSDGSPSRPKNCNNGKPCVDICLADAADFPVRLENVVARLCLGLAVQCWSKRRTSVWGTLALVNVGKGRPSKLRNSPVEAEINLVLSTCEEYFRKLQR